MSIYRLEHEDLSHLLELLAQGGRRLVGPTARDGTIVLDDVQSVNELPVGLRDQHSQGGYRLEASEDGSVFAFNVGPVSLKRFLFPPERVLFRTRRVQGHLEAEAPERNDGPIAVIGVRACDLAAMAIQDRVFIGDAYRDEGYAARREQLFIVAVNCASAGHNCFCTSMGTGPEVTENYDLLLTEVMEKADHYFLVQAGTTEGAAITTSLGAPAATTEEMASGRAVVEGARASVEKKLDTKGIKSVLYQCAESNHWEEVAKRCLSCGNCTMVCPTCFCSTVVDTTDLAGEFAERSQVWDSCFTAEYSQMHGGAVRETTGARYRQWMTHKLAGWHDQFGSSGCVGCGRCITWCPTGIDITEEVKGLRVLTETTV